MYSCPVDIAPVTASHQVLEQCRIARPDPLDRIEASRLVAVEFATRAHHQRARAWLEKLNDQRISYTDAVSFAVIQGVGCRTAMSFDHDFETAGYVLWRPA